MYEATSLHLMEHVDMHALDGGKCWKHNNEFSLYDQLLEIGYSTYISSTATLPWI